METISFIVGEEMCHFNDYLEGKLPELIDPPLDFDHYKQPHEARALRFRFDLLAFMYPKKWGPIKAVVDRIIEETGKMEIGTYWKYGKSVSTS